MWLMQNVPGITKHQAYDQARKEFYALRQEEQIERRVAKEEARMVGSYFGQTFLRVGMGLEDKQHEKWKAWATTEIQSVERDREMDDSDVPIDAMEIDVSALEEEEALTEAEAAAKTAR
jgi:small subunit ribosomal protein S23